MKQNTANSVSELWMNVFIHIGLSINYEITKYMYNARDVQDYKSYLKVDEIAFQQVKDFKYLGGLT